MPLIKPRTAAPEAGTTGQASTTGQAGANSDAAQQADASGDAAQKGDSAATQALPAITPKPGNPAASGTDAATQALPAITSTPGNPAAVAASGSEAATRTLPTITRGQGTEAATASAPSAAPNPETGRARENQPAREAGAAAPGSDDTVILPALRGRTTEQERERPPTGLPRPAAARPAADAAPGSPASDESHAANATDTTRAPRTPAVASVTETPRRRGPSRAMIGVGLAVVLIVAAAWLLVSLPGVPGGADWAGGGDRNWPPGAPGGTPTSEQPLSAPPASAPFASPEPGRPTDNGLVATPRSPAAAAAAKPAGTTPAAGTSPSDAAPTTGAPVAPTPTGSPLNGGNGIAPGQVEAESFAWQWGVTAAALDGASGGRGVSAVSNGDWLRFDALDLGGARTFKVRIANGSGSSGRIEIRYDSPWSAPMASVSVDNTGGWSQWRTRSVSCTSATGSRTVYVSFVSRSPGDFVYLDWISFS